MTDATALTGTAVREVAELAQLAEARGMTTRQIGEYQYAAQPLTRVNVDPALPAPREFFTLAGFVGFLEQETDIEPESVLVHVVSPLRVEVVGKLEGVDNHLRRHYGTAVCRSAALHGFSFNAPQPLETLHIALQTCFQQDVGEIQALRRFLASVKSAEEVGLADDGVSQTVSARRGISAVQTTGVVNLWPLAPWRTFAEITQPTSHYVLRFQQGEGEPRAGLYETGDSSWQVRAVELIAAFLRARLTDRWTVLG